MKLGIIILILFHIFNCLYCYYYEKVILLFKFETWCVFLISWSLFIYLLFILVLSVCVRVYNYWEFCFINLRIVNYFVVFSNYALATQYRSMLDNTSKLWKSIEVKYFFIFFFEKYYLAKCLFTHCWIFFSKSIVFLCITQVND